MLRLLDHRVLSRYGNLEALVSAALLAAGMVKVISSLVHGVGWPLYLVAVGLFLVFVPSIGELRTRLARRRSPPTAAPRDDGWMTAQLEALEPVVGMQERWMALGSECDALRKRMALVAPGAERRRLSGLLQATEERRARISAALNSDD